MGQDRYAIAGRVLSGFTIGKNYELGTHLSPRA